MRRFTIILALLAVAALPATALGKPNGTDRPVKGTSTSTTTVDVANGTGISDGSGQITHLGAFTFHNDFTGFAITGEDTFSWNQTATIVAANGDEIFATAVGTGTLSTGEATLVSTITGGTGRFADASGTLTTRISSVIVSQVGTTITSEDTETHTGTISY